MSYIGVQAENRVSPAFSREVITPDGSATYFDISNDVPGYNPDHVLVMVNNVVQEPNSSYTIKSDANNRPRRLDFGSAVLGTTDSLYIIQIN